MKNLSLILVLSSLMITSLMAQENVGQVEEDSQNAAGVSTIKHQIILFGLISKPCMDIMK